jgi:hypothetical protein
MKTYLGDGVYASYDGFHIILTTENGLRATNTICLEPDILEELVRYARRVSLLRAERQAGFE